MSNRREKGVETDQKGHRKPGALGRCEPSQGLWLSPCREKKSLQGTEQRSHVTRWQPAKVRLGSISKFIHGTVGRGLSSSPHGPLTVSAHDLAAGFPQSEWRQRERERLTLTSAVFCSTKSSPDSTGSESQVVWTTGDNPGQREKGRQRTAWKLPAVGDSGESGWRVSHLESCSRGRRRHGVLGIVCSANTTSCPVVRCENKKGDKDGSKAVG